MKIAILDDYAGLALASADWSRLQRDHTIDVFRETITADVVETLMPYDIICTMRERMRLPGDLIQRLTNLKLLCITGRSAASIDTTAARAAGITVCGTTSVGPGQHGTAELTWALLLMATRHLETETARMRNGLWQGQAGRVLAGKALGLLGLGHIGQRVAAYGRAFGMEVIAWSQNLTAEDASSHGVRRVDKAEMFSRSDFISIHVVLSPRSRGLVGAAELSAMKPDAWLINTSRAPIVEEGALMAALAAKSIGGAALDVHYREPLPANDPIRKMPNVLLTPHLGYTVHERMRDYFPDIVDDIENFLQGTLVRLFEG